MAAPSTPPTSFSSLNGVRPKRPEQLAWLCLGRLGRVSVSMESGLRGRNNQNTYKSAAPTGIVSMESGLRGRNNSSPRKATLTRDFTSTCELSAPPGPIKPLC